MPTAKELFEKYMKFDNNENDHKCISMFGYTVAEIIEALEFWGKAKDKDFLLGEQWTTEEINRMQAMTRREAIEKLKAVNVLGDYYILNALEALGLIKFKEPEELPIFEVRYPSGSHTYKIWASGRTEGFNKDVIVINRIPQFEARLIQKYSK